MTITETQKMPLFPSEAGIAYVPPASDAPMIEGKGLITGQPVSATVTPGLPGQGIVFLVNEGAPIQALLSAVVHTERGITLASTEDSGNNNQEKQIPKTSTLSIPEHFLAATALCGLDDLTVTITGAPELPILDGSAENWVAFFRQNFTLRRPEPSVVLNRSVVYRHTDDIVLYALPDDHFKITYSVNFPHPALAGRWARWDSQHDTIETLAGATTFGFVDELPVLQAKGLAMGADETNTLGLTRDGGYTRPLKTPDEPIYHKALDLIGDLRLSGINPLTLKAHIFAINAGHSSHVKLAAKLADELLEG
ncbi:MAG: UDP-3-O-acyl-N-acetylglucosamine deacetylase [Cyanobacteria bacterium P01_H01_bin.74]